jgi:glycerate 2-kinase
LIRDALQRGCRELILGLGSSATNDGGDLLNLDHIDIQNRLKELEKVQITIACDIKNPLYGPYGAAGGSAIPPVAYANARCQYNIHTL